MRILKDKYFVYILLAFLSINIAFLLFSNKIGNSNQIIKTAFNKTNIVSFSSESSNIVNFLVSDEEVTIDLAKLEENKSK